MKHTASMRVMRLVALVVAVAWAPACDLWTKTDCETDDDCLWWRQCLGGECVPLTAQADASKGPLDASIPDSGLSDAAVEDAGQDAGPRDAGLDGGPTDAGRDGGLDASDAAVGDAAAPRDAAITRDSSVTFDAAPRPDSAVMMDAAGVDAATMDADGGCLCGTGQVCMYSACLPGCVGDTSCGFGGTCDTAGTALCQCADNLQPCGAQCCAITMDTVAARDAGTGGWMGEGLSMAIDSWGHVHVAYYEEDGQQNGTLWYARHDGQNWLREPVDQGTLVGQDPALTLDMLDWPHIAYSGGGSVGLRYATFNGSIWTHDDVGLELCGSDNDIVVRGTPGVDLNVFMATAGLALQYAYGVPGSWNYEVIDSFGGQDPSLRFNADGVAHVAFYDRENTQLSLKLAIRTGPGTWDQRVVEINLADTTNPSLDFDRLGQPNIAYRDSSRNALRVAVRFPVPDAGTFAWGKATLDTTGAGYYPVLRLDQNDDPIVAYTYSTGAATRVRLLRYRNGTGLITTMDQGTGTYGVGGCFRSYVGMCLDMELDDQGNPVMVYPDLDRKAVVVTR